MKRIVWLILLLLLFCGCEKNPSVGLCQQDNQDHPLLLEALVQAGYRVETRDAAQDQARQTEQVQGLLQDGIRLLVVDPVMQSEVPLILSLCREAEVPVILLGNEPEEDILSIWEKVCYIGFRPADGAGLQSQFLPQGDWNADGETAFALLSGPENHLDAAAWAGSFPENGCLDTAWGNWDRETGRQNMARLLSQWGKDLEVVLCDSAIQALGAMDAIREGGRTVGQDIDLIGFGGDKQSRLLVRSGDLSATVCEDWAGYGQQVAQAAGELLSGGVREQRQYGTYLLLTQENIEDYLG